MLYYKHAEPLLVVLMFGFVFCSNVSIAQTADDAALVVVATGFFEAYQRKDVDGLIALWSAKAPERPYSSTKRQ
jgi:hypothetical protein